MIPAGMVTTARFVSEEELVVEEAVPLLARMMGSVPVASGNVMVLAALDGAVMVVAFEALWRISWFEVADKLSVLKVGVDVVLTVWSWASKLAHSEVSSVLAPMIKEVAVTAPRVVPPPLAVMVRLPPEETMKSV